MDKLVQQAFPLLTGRQVEEAIERGWVRGKTARIAKGTRVDSQDTLEMGALRDQLERLKRGDSQLAIAVVHEDPAFWVVDKPAGVPGHPLSLDEIHTVTHWAIARDPGLLDHFPEPQPTLTPHRLDTGTSGALVVARSRESFQLWRERFTRKQVTKTYRAWCWGTAKADAWTCDGPIGRDKGREMRMAVDGREARPALSRVRVLVQKPDRFLCEVVCETGVTHQVRVHLASSGHPLLSDAKYDLQFAARPSEGVFERHALRATALVCEGRTYAVSLDGYRET